MALLGENVSQVGQMIHLSLLDDLDLFQGLSVWFSSCYRVGPARSA